MLSCLQFEMSLSSIHRVVISSLQFHILVCGVHTYRVGNELGASRPVAARRVFVMPYPLECLSCLLVYIPSNHYVCYSTPPFQASMYATVFLASKTSTYMMLSFYCIRAWDHARIFINSSGWSTWCFRWSCRQWPCHDSTSSITLMVSSSFMFSLVHVNPNQALFRLCYFATKLSRLSSHSHDKAFMTRHRSRSEDTA